MCVSCFFKRAPGERSSEAVYFLAQALTPWVVAGVVVVVVVGSAETGRVRQSMSPSKNSKSSIAAQPFSFFSPRTISIKICKKMTQNRKIPIFRQFTQSQIKRGAHQLS